MQQKQITRKHMSHEHKMAISLPQTDKRLIIPEDTFTELEGPKVSLPFRYLWGWLFSLLALIALPLGLMLSYVGSEMQNSSTNWQEMTATVAQANENAVRYQVDSLRSKTANEFSFAPDNFVTTLNGGIGLHLTACDLVSRFIVPQEQGASFSVWVNPEDNSQQSCIPVDATSGEMYFTIGMILVLLSAWRLIRTIHAASSQPKKA